MALPAQVTDPYLQQALALFEREMDEDSIYELITQERAMAYVKRKMMKIPQRDQV